MFLISSVRESERDGALYISADFGTLLRESKNNEKKIQSKFKNKILKSDISENVKIQNFGEFRQSPADTVPKLNVYKTFRRCPGRLLNVLCTFNLGTVSVGSKTTIFSQSQNGSFKVAIKFTAISYQK